MYKRLLAFFIGIILFSLFFSFNVYANVEIEIDGENISAESNEDNNDFKDYDADGGNYVDSVEIPNSYDENEEKQKNRDLYYGQIYGFIYWTDDENSTHALEGVTVVIDPHNGYNYVTTTGATDFYSLGYSLSIYPSSLFVDIKIYASNNNVKVYKPDNSIYKKDDTIYLSGTLSSVYNYTFNNATDGNNSRAMQIFSAMQNYYNYADSVIDSQVPLCKVVYPHEETDANNNYKNYCYYANGADTIYLKNENDVYNSPYVYSSWDVIGHEYGHHLQYHFFNHIFYGTHNSSRCDYYNLVYYDQQNSNPTYQLPLSDSSLAEIKENGCGLAFKESWPTFFAITAQQSFSTDIKTVPTVANSSYEDYLGTNHNISNLYVNNSSYSTISGGESDENLIMSILYNLWDTNNSENWDNISISDTDLFDFMIDINPKNLSEFLYCLIFNNNINVSMNDIAKMSEAYHLSPYGLSICSYANSSHGQGFTWSRGNANFTYGNTTYSVNNNQFILDFYDENDTLLLRKSFTSSNPYAISDTETYVLSLSEWNAVLQCQTARYYLVVSGRSTNYYMTYPYYSERYYFNIPTTYDINLTDFSYYEKVFNINQGQEWLFNMNFSHSGYKLIQTFGSKDTKIYLYNDSNVLLASSDDDGYVNNSLIYYNFSSNETYHLYVEYYSQTEYGQTKLSIVPCSGNFASGLTSIDEFDDINILDGQTDFYYQTTVPQNESVVLIWMPYTTGYYNVCLFSSFDNILYLVNPSSSSALVMDYDYCDDYLIDSDNDIYDSNAEIDRIFYAGEIYFIVIGKSNPALSSGNITLSIHRTM